MKGKRKGGKFWFKKDVDEPYCRIKSSGARKPKRATASTREAAGVLAGLKPRASMKEVNDLAQILAGMKQ